MADVTIDRYVRTTKQQGLRRLTPVYVNFYLHWGQEITDMNKSVKTLAALALGSLVMGAGVSTAFAGETANHATAEAQKAACSGKGGCGGAAAAGESKDKASCKGMDKEAKDSCKGKDGCNGKDSCKSKESCKHAHGDHDHSHDHTH